MSINWRRRNICYRALPCGEYGPEIWPCQYWSWGCLGISRGSCKLEGQRQDSTIGFESILGGGMPIKRSRYHFSLPCLPKNKMEKQQQTKNKNKKKTEREKRELPLKCRNTKSGDSGHIQFSSTLKIKAYQKLVHLIFLFPHKKILVELW